MYSIVREVKYFVNLDTSVIEQFSLSIMIRISSFARGITPSGSEAPNTEIVALRTRDVDVSATTEFCSALTQPI